MRIWTKIFLTLVALVFFPLGCAGLEEERRNKCPKCGEIFRIQTMPPDAPPPRY